MNPSSAFKTPFARLARAARRWREARSGAAAVEFAAIAPFILALFVPLADLGAYVYSNMELQLAAQAGAEYAARHQWNPTGIQNAIITAAPGLKLSLVDGNVPNNNDVLPSPFDPAHVQFCGCASGSSVTQNSSPPANGCANPRPTCPGTGLQSGVYYTVGAQTVYHTISGFAYPFLANNQLLTAYSTVRVQ
jgi:hypothetical protein